MKRAAFIDEAADRICSVQRDHPVRVGIDGVDGVGKTMLADELVSPIRDRGRPVIRASIDGFHNPRRVRYARGRDSPEGYFIDSFDLDALVKLLLAPLGPGGSGAYTRAVFDYRRDLAVEVEPETAAGDAVLLFDGVFLHRPELLAHWDFSIFLDAPFEITVARMAGRDGGSPDPDEESNRRYVDGQRLYLREHDPRSAASLVVDHGDWSRPEIVAGQDGAPASS
jgi:uridine kinase